MKPLTAPRGVDQRGCDITCCSSRDKAYGEKKEKEKEDYAWHAVDSSLSRFLSFLLLFFFFFFRTR